MQKFRNIVIFCLTAMLLLSASFAETTPVMLFKVYRQSGWGDRVQAAAVDEKGGLWYYETEDGYDFPYEESEQIDYLMKSGNFALTDTLDGAETQRLYYLVMGLETVNAKSVPVADDAGTQTCVAFRNDGKEMITLGVSGSDLYENTDPAAQELYRMMQVLFPDVTDFRGEEIAPKGFLEMTLKEWYGLTDDELSGAMVKAYRNDCEEGITETECDCTLEQLLSRKVTGKKNNECVTGNTVLYRIYDKNGECLVSIEFFDDLLAASDGMYYIA